MVKIKKIIDNENSLSLVIARVLHVNSCFHELL